MSINLNATEVNNLIHVLDHAFEVGAISKWRKGVTIDLQAKLIAALEGRTQPQPESNDLTA